ncbi:hypothetical protein B0J12DRAFT_682203 [Macrophomina phaseolina]|uniref:Secreted protein n=1 Tax=Macrophomina phaseolina TaxID=35725 RepID=A0ABQ8FW86_9PEZI|nr:hypothetical protein B0J12DRAFT_682203 [Macrophomina phaseolina]
MSCQDGSAYGKIMSFLLCVSLALLVLFFDPDARAFSYLHSCAQMSARGHARTGCVLGRELRHCPPFLFLGTPRCSRYAWS